MITIKTQRKPTYFSRGSCQKKRNKKYNDMYYNRKLAMPSEVVEEIEYNNKQIKFLSKKLPRKYYEKSR